MNKNILHGAATILLFVLLGNFQTLRAQGVSISETNSPPDPSAMLDVQSVTKGMLIPRMTAGQRVGIAAPANGLIVYQTSNSATTRRGFWYYDGPQAEWIFLGAGEFAGTVEQPNTLVSSTVPGAGVTPIPDVGQITINWGIMPEISSPPTVLVSPEYSIVSTPPDTSFYCKPVTGGCNANTTKPKFVRICHPSPDWNNTNYNQDGPWAAAQFVHEDCNGTNDNTYQYQPHNAVHPLFNFNANNDNNNFVINFCTDGPAAGELAFMMQMAPGNVNHSFSFFADLNQDGDFNDPGELLAIMPDLLPTAGAYFVFSDNVPFSGWSGPIHPPVQVPNTAAEGMTKLRVIVHRAVNAISNPCYGGNNSMYVYDFDMEILCTGVLPLYPSDLNWCNVDDVTNYSARVSCFDKNGSPADIKFHYKVVPHN